MAWGAIAGAVIGGVMSNKASKRSSNAVDAANAANMAGFNLAKPYLDYGYSQGKDAYNYALDKGVYTGDTYANMNDMSKAGYNYMNDFGIGGQGDAVNFMNQGRNFGSNYADLYNQAGKNNLAAANNYATNNSQSLIDSAMRDSTRQLNEQTLPNINMGASGTGNINSSRAGVADAIARRSYDDRLTDTTATIENKLANDYLTNQNNMFANQMNANANLANTYGSGFGMGMDISNMMTGAGNAFNKDAQNQLDADRIAHEKDAAYKMDINNKYMSGTMGKAPTSSTTTQPNLYDPNMSALYGGMQGFGFGGQMMNSFGGNTNYGSSGNPFSYYGTGGTGGQYSSFYPTFT
jgi:hypothetical protein